MYRHHVDSIMESDKKVFVSKTEKDKFKTYESTFINAADTYNKEEMDKYINDLNENYVTVEGDHISEANTVVGNIENIELYGNTLQPVDISLVTPDVLTPGGISKETGHDVPTDNGCYRTDFIEVKYNDGLVMVNKQDTPNEVNLFLYDKSKKYIKTLGVVPSAKIDSYDVAYVRFFADSIRMSTMKMKITRTYSKDIESVGVPIDNTNNAFSVKVKICGENMCDGKYSIGNYDPNGVYQNINRRVIISDNFISVKPNSKYYVKHLEGIIDVPRAHLFNENHIRIKEFATSEFTTPPDCRYIKLQYNKFGSSNVPEYTEQEIADIASKSILTTVNIEEYIPHEMNISEIVLPCQLEKSDNTSDRLFRRDDGIWCIEKNIGTININDCKLSVYSTKTMKCHYLIFDHDDIPLYKEIRQIKSIVNSLNLPYEYSESEFNHMFLEHNDSLVLFLDKTQYNMFNDLNSAREYFKKSENNIVFKIPYITPQIIELPLETQLHLNSLLDITNIFMNNKGVNGKIKCTMTKSTGASINSLVNSIEDLSDRIEPIKEMKDGQTIKYITDCGCISISDNNVGVVDNIELEGKSLVNVLPNEWETVTDYGDGKTVTQDKDFIKKTSTNIKVKPNTVYTICASVQRNTLSDGQLFILVDKHLPGDYIGSTHTKIPNGFNGLFISTFTTGAVIEERTLQKAYMRTMPSCKNPGTITVGKVMIIEGDHTKSIPSHFRGLKSVGDSNLILSASNSNIINLNNLKNQMSVSVEIELGYITESGLKMTTKPTNTGKYPSIWFDGVKFIPGVKYRFSVKCEHTNKTNKPLFSIRSSLSNSIPLIDMGPDENGMIKGTFIAQNENHRVEFFNGHHVGDITGNTSVFSELHISVDNTDGPYVNPVKDEKNIMYYNKMHELCPVVLRSLPNGVRDTIEKHSDGKYYYHKRCEEIILNGNSTEIWSIDEAQSTGPNSKLYRLGGFTSSIAKDMQHPLSDRFISAGPYNTDSVEGIIINNNHLRVRLLNSKISTPDFNGFITWLKANNTTVVYQMAIEEVYECNDLSLSTYDTTIFSCHSGPIYPKMKISVASYIGNVVNNIKDRISLIEDNMYQKYIRKNKSMLVNKHSSDSTLFKVAVDVSKIYNVSDHIDDILVELLLKNILPGKENYNRIEMEEIIDFYTIVGKLSFEIADELFSMIDAQYTEVDLSTDEV